MAYRAPKPAVGRKVRVPARPGVLTPVFNPAATGGLLGPAGQSKGSVKDPTTIAGQFGKVSPAAGTPGALVPPAPPPAPTPLPWDTQYETTIAGINKNRDLGHQDIHAQQIQLSRDSGYSYDPATGNVGIDTTDPFSRRQLLVQNYARARAGSTNSMAARGQLYSGALQNAQNLNSTNYLQADDTQQKGYRDAALALLRQDQGIDTTADQGIIDAGGTRLDRSIAGAQQNPVDPGVPAQPKGPLGGLPSSAGKTPTSQIAWLKTAAGKKWLAGNQKWATGHPVAIGALKG